jgi:hypothetical protein
VCPTTEGDASLCNLGRRWWAANPGPCTSLNLRPTSSLSSRLVQTFLIEGCPDDTMTISSPFLARVRSEILKVRSAFPCVTPESLAKPQG